MIKKFSIIAGFITININLFAEILYEHKPETESKDCYISVSEEEKIGDGVIFSFVVKATGCKRTKGFQLFDSMIEHYKNKNIAIKGIRALWFYGSNLEYFNSKAEPFLKTCLELKDIDTCKVNLKDVFKGIAAETWTGKQAIRHGFIRVSEVLVDTYFDTKTNKHIIYEVSALFSK